MRPEVLDPHDVEVARVHDSFLTAAPPPITGAVGCPVDPVAVR